ncbi:peptide/nickel transport system permease protein [Prauserella marina]|uniref:Peptide/nickel transport system permease protein n=1 Tax=Prauserella marina TaxID=530584 RepID=A0A1G6RJN3_9PSEU|nr:ABC transporter permease [Prauserella marina]PWV77119.1 peptide/nickel transport system permease protein [Prauserella marina]SDD04859.1 peptide/nickel transport system permease protein [Prauserella marina]
MSKAAGASKTPAPDDVKRRPARRLTRYGIAPLVAATVLGLFILTALFGPLLVPYDSVATSVADRLLPPGSTLSDGSTALLGTDQDGRDVFAQVIAGSRVSLLVAVTVVVVAGVLGLVLGLLAGYYGGWLDTVISRVGDMQLAFPSILLAILLAGALGPSLLNVIIALAVTRWVIFARVVRGSALSVRNREFVDSARVMGASDLRIMARYIYPSCVQPLLVAATVQVGLTMVAEAALSFLGLGVPIDQASWGSTIANGRDYLASAWWIAAIPGLALTLVVICIGLLGDAGRDRGDRASQAVMR